MPDTSENTRCVVLAAPGRSKGGDLAGRLRTRGWDTVSFSDPCLAMAELCLEDRTQSARTAWGLRPSRQLVLAIAPTPGAALGTERLVAAVHRYLPHVEVWLSEGGELLPVPREGTPPTPPVADPPPTRAADRLADAPGDDDGADDNAEDAALAPVEITREEIDMLFAHGDETQEP